MALVSTAKPDIQSIGISPSLPNFDGMKNPSKANNKVHPALFFTLGLMILCSFLLYRHTVYMEWQANEQQQSIIKMKEKNDYLQATLAQLKTLPTVEAKAKLLGMKPVTNFQYIAMNKNLFQMANNQAVMTSPKTYQPIEPPIAF